MLEYKTHDRVVASCLGFIKKIFDPKDTGADKKRKKPEPTVF